MRVAYFLVGYPNPTQTFIQREVETLRAKGLDVVVFCSRQWQNSQHEKQGAVGWTWRWIFDFFIECLLFLGQPVRLWWAVCALARYRWRGWENFWTGVWGIITGMAVARTIRKGGFQHIHAGWAALAATAALVAAKRSHLPFSFAGHAYDLYRHGGDGWLREKARHATFIHTSTHANVRHLAERFPEYAGKILQARRGLIQMPAFREPLTKLGEPVQILSVGRLVEKKGQRHQLSACMELADGGVKFHLSLVGSGPLKEKLQSESARLGLSREVTFRGALNYAAVEELYAGADVFWHTGVTDAGGDRDGLPNAVPEAMAHGVPVIVFEGGAVTEAVHHGETGLVVPTGRGDLLAAETERLINDFELRRKLILNARRWAEENYDAGINTGKLAAAIRSGGLVKRTE